jgi:hypothetical protein
MMDIESLEFLELVKESEKLRDEGKFAEAAGLMAAKYGHMEPECLKVACRHTIRITRQGGLNELALRHATELAKIEPGDPLVLELLEHHSHKTGQGGLNESAKSISIPS